jgi:hypothetical protein
MLPLTNYVSFLIKALLVLGFMLILINFSFSMYRISNPQRAVIFVLYISIEIFCAFFYELSLTSPILIMIFFVLRYGKVIVLLITIFGYQARRVIVFCYIILETIVPILTQTILFFLNIPANNNQLSSIAILNWMDSLIILAMLPLLLFSTKNIVLRNAMRGLSVFPVKVFVLIFATLSLAASLQNNVLALISTTGSTLSLVKGLSLVLTPILILLVIYFMVIHNSRSIFEQAVANLTDQISVQISHYEILNAHENELRKFRHDYANMIICLKALLQAKDISQASTFIDDMADSINYGKPAFDTGNYIADALLSEKSQKASQSNISFDFSGFIPSYRITDFDLCIILTNALDNAIEACAEITGSKVIEISSEIKNGFWFLQIKNPVKRQVSITNNTILTTKSDSLRHGFGLYSIELTAKKGNGHMKLSCSDHTFSIETVMALNNLLSEEAVNIMH